MGNNFEKLIIGSAHEGAEGMFQLPGDDETLDSETLQMKRLERGIFPDAQARFEATIAKLGYEQVRELSEDITYPTVDEWVEHRLRYARGTRFFPSFIKNQEGEIFFCKAQISSNPDAVSGLTHEAETISTLEKEINAPQIINYVEPTEEQSAILITEAIPADKASVAPPEAWNEGHVISAVDQIKFLENRQLPDVSSVDYTEPVADLLNRAKLPEDLAEQVRLVINQYRPFAKPVFVHGDAAMKNILVSTPADEPKAYFVDWELAGQGFMGQDAAKLWSGFTKGNPELQTTLVNRYVATPEGKVDRQRQLALVFGVIAENLTHITWRQENIVAPGKAAEFPNVHQEIEHQTERIRKILTIIEE